MIKYVLIVAALLLAGCAEYERSHDIRGWQHAMDQIAENCEGELTIELDINYRSSYKVTCVQSVPFKTSLVEFDKDKDE